MIVQTLAVLLVAIYVAVTVVLMWQLARDRHAVSYGRQFYVMRVVAIVFWPIALVLSILLGYIERGRST